MYTSKIIPIQIKCAFVQTFREKGVEYKTNVKSRKPIVGPFGNFLFCSFHFSVFPRFFIINLYHFYLYKNHWRIILCFALRFILLLLSEIWMKIICIYISVLQYSSFYNYKCSIFWLPNTLSTSHKGLLSPWNMASASHQIF